MERIIIHMDFDYFFAQIEEKRHPNYKDKPIIVCIYSGRSSDSGAVSTSNYKSREYGVKAGIPISLAKKKLDNIDALFLPADHEHYSQISDQIIELLYEFGDVVEKASIDEAYLDTTEKVQGDWVKVEQFAKQIKRKIYETFELTCSIGVAPNKLVAKMASDFEKPDGLTIVVPDSVSSFLDPLPVRSIPGVGEKTEEILLQHDIKKISDLHHTSPVWLIEQFGKKAGRFLIDASKGKDDSPVEQNDEVKQFSRIKTLKQNSLDFVYILKESEELINDLVSKLTSKELLCSTVGIIAIDSTLQLVTKAKTLHFPTDERDVVAKSVSELWQELLSGQKEEIRRIGVKVEKLSKREGQKTLGDF